MTPRQRLDAARAHLDQPPAETLPGQLGLDVTPPAGGRAARDCDAGNPRCGARPVRPYPCGYRCDQHKPQPTRRQEPTP